MESAEPGGSTPCSERRENSTNTLMFNSSTWKNTKHLLQKSRKKLPHVTISARTLSQYVLNLVHDCKDQKSVAVYGVCGRDMLLRMLIALPRLVRAQLDVVSEAAETASQLITVVDILDKSTKGHTWFVLRAHCTSQAAEYDMTRVVWNLREFLAFNTDVSMNYMRYLEEQCSRMKEGKLSFSCLGGEKCCAHCKLRFQSLDIHSSIS